MKKAFLLILFFFLFFTLVSLAIIFLIFSMYHNDANRDNRGSSQDICVADLNSDLMIDGFACKPADKVAETDFFFAGLAGTKPSAAAAPLGSAVTAGDVLAIPGLNTLGISMSRIDYAAAGGLNPPHLHPRASEILFVIAGRLEVGFVTAAGKLVSKTVSKGQIFVFPRGLMHFERNKDDVLATAIVAFDSELPGTQRVPVALFAAVPPVADFVLARAFGLETKVVKKIEAGITPKN